MAERVECTLEGFLITPSQDGGLEILQLKRLQPEDVEKVRQALEEESHTGNRPEDSIIWDYSLRSDDTLVPLDRLFRSFIPPDNRPISLRITIEQLADPKLP